MWKAARKKAQNVAGFRRSNRMKRSAATIPAGSCVAAEIEKKSVIVDAFEPKSAKYLELEAGETKHPIWCWMDHPIVAFLFIASTTLAYIAGAYFLADFLLG